MKVGELMTTGVVAVQEDYTVAQAAEAMAKNGTGAVLVLRGEELRGILVDRQIACDCVGKGKDANTARVTEVMSSEPQVGSPEMDLLDAAKVMGEGKFRRLPIVEDGRVVGLISMADVADYVSNINAWIFDELTKSTKKRLYKDRHP